ncbi:hypothetical protein TNCV_52281 [Trichonephila clavipes]|nr:hypothetical protein TNCV_52281 [Trichonephila clavipes]
MNPDSNSAHTRVEMTRPPVRPGICYRETYYDNKKCDSERSNLLGHTIACINPSTPFNGTQLRGRDFNAGGTFYAIKFLRFCLSTSKCWSTFCCTLPTMSLTL